MTNAYAYLAPDRRLAMSQAVDLPPHATGAVLFADISGFTPLTDALVRRYGPRRGADELTRHLNNVYRALIDELERFGGSVIGFSGDAITCWFGEERGEGRGARGDLATRHPLPATRHSAILNAFGAASAMQQAMNAFAEIEIVGGTVGKRVVQLAVKIAIAAGDVRRFCVGDPAIQLIDVLAGNTLNRMAAAEQMAEKGEIVVDEQTHQSLDKITPIEWRIHPTTQERFACIPTYAGTSLDAPLATRPSPPFDFAQGKPAPLPESALKPWVLPTVYTRLQISQSQFLAEMRPATALFLKFGGIDYDNDPAAGEKLDGYIRYVQRIIAHYEGALIQLTTGDKGSYLYAAFGAPLAHDDNPQRAIAAALELRNIPAEFGYIQEVHIGLSQGTMRTGPYGSPTRQTYGVLGDETNVAARLMSRAEAGQILISQALYESVHEEFQTHDLGKVQLKGKPTPQTIYAVMGRQPRVGEDLQQLYNTPLSGRSQELAQMHERLRQVLAEKRGHILRIEGEAGIGKSHLVATFLKEAESYGVRTAATFCQSTERDIAYHAARQVARALLQLNEGLSIPEQIAHLQQVIHTVQPDWEARIPLLGELLGLPIADTPTTAAFDPKLRQEALTSLAMEMLLQGGQNTPVVLLAEDIHWMDEGSQSLLLALGRVIHNAPILLLLVHRPTSEASAQTAESFLGEVRQLASQSHLPLGELSGQAITSLLTQRLQGEVSPLARAVIERKTQGNPFFCEELVDALLEHGQLQRSAIGVWRLSDEAMQALHAAKALVRQGEGWELAANAALNEVDLGVPDSIQGVVLARLDRLPESVKATLKIASVIGRVFEFDLLTQAHPSQPAASELQSQLSEALQREFVRMESSVFSAGETISNRPSTRAPSYFFKHNITQEVVYSTLLEGQRQTLHNLVGEALESNQPAASERLAYHFYNGDLQEPAVRQKAIRYLDQAAQRAQREYANETALSYLERALNLQREGRWLKAKIEILHILARRPEEEALLKELSQQKDTPLFDQELLWSEYYESISEYQKARVCLRKAIQAAKQSEDVEGEVRGLSRLGLIAWRQGNYKSAIRYYRKALKSIRNEARFQDEEAEIRYGLGLVYRQLGQYQDAQVEFERDLALNREIGNQQLEARALNAMGTVNILRHSPQEAISYFQQALGLRERIGDHAGVGATLYNLADQLGALGDYDQAEIMLQKAIHIQQSIGNRSWEANTWNGLGTLYLRIGDRQAAIKCMEQGLQICEETGQENTKAYLLYNLGLAMVQNHQIKQAEAFLLDVQQLAEKQADIDLLASCLSDLASIYLQQQQFEQAVQTAYQAIQHYQTLALEQATVSSLATIAHAQIALSNRAEAIKSAFEAMKLLDKYEGTGQDAPQRDYWMCYQVLKAVNQVEYADHALQAAYRLMIAQAKRIHNPIRREAFLQNFTYHQEILKEVEELKVTGTDGLNKPQSL